MNRQAVDDWLRINRQLLDMEMAFGKLAVRVAEGEESEDILQKERQKLEAMRELCTAAYQRAFPRLDAAP